MPEPPAGPRTVRTARSILVLTACEALGKVGTLVIVVGVARVLSITDFGVFAVAIGAGALVAVLPSWGFDTLLVQQGAGTPSLLPELLTQVLVIRCAMIGAFLLGSVGVAAAIGKLDAALLPAALLVLGCLLETVADAFRNVAIALEAPGTVAIGQLVQRTFAAAAVLTVLLVSPSLLLVAEAYLAGAVAGMVAMAVATARLGVRPRLTGLSGARLRRFCRLSYASGLHSVASMALFRLDAVLLAALAGAAAAGRYAASYRLLETVIFVAWTVARSVFPAMASASDTAGVRRGAERGLVVLASVFLPYMALLWTRGGDLMRLLYGASFQPDLAALAWLAPAPLLFGAAYLAAYALMAAGPTPQVLVGSVGALVFNTVLNFVLIPPFGPAGAAIATTVAYAVEVALLYPATRRRIGRPTLAAPLAPAVVATAAVAGVLLLPIAFPAAVTLAALVYLLVWLTLVTRFDPEQVRVLRGLRTGLLPGRSTP